VTKNWRKVKNIIILVENWKLKEKVVENKFLLQFKFRKFSYFCGQQDPSFRLTTGTEFYFNLNDEEILFN